MDRLDAMLALVTTVDSGSLAAAARRLGRSPAAITRSVALLEQRNGAPLLPPTPRSGGPTGAGEGYPAAAASSPISPRPSSPSRANTRRRAACSR